MTQILYPLQLERPLKGFRLSGMAKSLGSRLKQAEQANLSYTEFLAFLLQDETNTRADNRRQPLYKSAKLPFEKGLRILILLSSLRSTNGRLSSLQRANS